MLGKFADSLQAGVARGESRRLLDPLNADRSCTRVLINAIILPSSVQCSQSIVLCNTRISEKSYSKYYKNFCSFTIFYIIKF